MKFHIDLNKTERTLTFHWVIFYGAETKRRVS